MKTCCNCEKIKPASEFWKSKGSKDGLRSRCKKCQMEYRRTWGNKNSAVMRRINKKGHLKRVFGLTPEDYRALSLCQRGVCKICGEVNQSKRDLAVDHCHKTGIVRGLLCSKCNFMLGLADDSPSRLIAAAAYLESALTVPRTRGTLT